MIRRKKDFIIGQGGIDQVEKVTLGGVEQYILLQGQSRNNPVLLFLHGGPSMPIPGVSSRGKNYTIATNVKHLIEHYIVVFWDQRGTGKSYNSTIPVETMTIKQFISDTIELTEYLRHKFKQPKLYLAAHSWGTIIGLRAASEHPDKYYSYVGISQVLNWTENDRLALQWTKDEATRRNNQKAIHSLSSVGEPPFIESFEQWSVLRKWQQRFGTLIYTDDQIKHPGLKTIMFDMLSSKDYTIKDIFNSFVAGSRLVYTTAFINELTEINYINQITDLKLPITFIHGRHDVHIFGSIVEQYFHQLETTSDKYMYWLDHSSHLFHPNDTEIIEKWLISQTKYNN